MIITESLLMITGLNGSLGGIDIDGMIKSGAIIQYWLNPLGFAQYLIGMEIGRFLYYLIWRCIPIFLIGCFILRWFPQMSIYHVFLLVLSVILAIILANLIQFIITMLAIRFKTSNGIVDLFMAAALFFSGGLLPLDFFPDWLYKISVFLPFSAQIYLPVSIALGTGGNMEGLLLLELTWIVLFSVVSYILYRRERRYLIVQGG